MSTRAVNLAKWFVTLWFTIGGLGHFVAADFFVRITPAWVPHPLEVVWLSGALELAGAAGLWSRALRRWAAGGLFLLTLAVSPANIEMALHPEQFPEFPVALLYLRLLLQVGLLAAIAVVWRQASHSASRA